MNKSAGKVILCVGARPVNAVIAHPWGVRDHRILWTPDGSPEVSRPAPGGTTSPPRRGIAVGAHLRGNLTVRSCSVDRSATGIDPDPRATFADLLAETSDALRGAAVELRTHV